MEKLVANLVGSVTRAPLEGRDCLVAPVTLIVPGVLNGSRGPLLYPPEHVEQSVNAWNGVPLTLGHPPGVSARSPSVLNQRRLGSLFDVRMEAGRLRGAAWFDIERLRTLAPGLEARILNGARIEVSTGLYTDNDPAPEGATFNGVPYQFIARNYRPDHLAILVDERGACSVEDGCGVNNQTPEEAMPQEPKPDTNQEAPKLPEADRTALIEQLVANECDCLTKDLLDGLPDDKLQALNAKLAETHTGNAGGKEEPRPLALGNCSDEELWNEVRKRHLDKKDENKNLEANNMANETPKAETPETPKAETPETNAAKATVPTAPQAPLAYAKLSPEDEAILNWAKAEQTRQKETLVVRLVANVAEEQRTDVANRLMAKPLDELQMLATLIPASKPEPQPALNFLGAATPEGVRTPTVNREDVLPLPQYEWAKSN